MLAGALAALIVYLLVRNAQLNDLVLYMLLWEAFGLTYILITWSIFFTRSIDEIRKTARVDDGGRTFVYSFILVAFSPA